jgi:hypothetical protein
LKRKIFAVITLLLLIGVPFLDWRLGSVMWMSAWLVFIFQKLLGRQGWKLGGNDEPPPDDPDQQN